MVTGASRGVGRGVAISLAAAGFDVFATGRTVQTADLPPAVHRIGCDHLNDAETSAAFDEVRAKTGAMDVLVNSAWGGYERMLENGEFTWPLPFWEQPLHRWTSMLDAGVRAAFVASSLAAKMMIARGDGFTGSGLIVNISYWAARKPMGNVIYGVSKAATDKMTADMARELLAYGISVISLYPGLVRRRCCVPPKPAGSICRTAKAPSLSVV
jgi:dehydrogenase/reductase SDR family protein 1